MSTYKREMGKQQIAYTPTFPARRYTYRHDTVYADGVKLEGIIQTRVRFGRTEVITAFRNSCVMGYQPEWLERMNRTEVTAS